MIASRQGESEISDSLLVKVIDFGIAKITGTGIDQTQADFIGTPAYASPEFTGSGDAGRHPFRHLLFRNYTLVFDFWKDALRRPHFGRNPKKQSDELPLEQLRMANVPAKMIALLKSMLAVDPGDRPQSRANSSTRFSDAASKRLTSLRVEAALRREEGFWTAVLPFKFSGDPEIAGFAEGLTEEIVTGMARFPYLRVIAPSLTARYLSESIVVRRVGNELGARYLLEGSLRQAGNKLRIAVQLVDTDSGAHLWARPSIVSGKRRGSSICRTKSPISSSARLPMSMACLLVRSPRPRPKSLRKLSRPTKLSGGSFSPSSEAARRITCLRGLRSRKPSSFSRATLKPGRHWPFCFSMNIGMSSTLGQFAGARRCAAERALDADPASQMANYAFAVVQYFRGDLGAFRAAAERALALNPRCSYTMAWVGRLFCYSGDWERGIQLTTRAIQLSPHHPGWYHFGIFFNEYRQRRYAEALAVLQTINMPDYWVMHFITAMAQAQVGNQSAAQTEVERTLQLCPEFEQFFGRTHLQSGSLTNRTWLSTCWKA